MRRRAQATDRGVVLLDAVAGVRAAAFLRKSGGTSVPAVDAFEAAALEPLTPEEARWVLDFEAGLFDEYGALVDIVRRPLRRPPYPTKPEPARNVATTRPRFDDA